MSTIPEGWTTEPTEPGWYWRREDSSDKARMFNLVEVNGTLLASGAVSLSEIYSDDDIATVGGIWQGPLRPQEPGTVTVSAAELEELRRCKAAWAELTSLKSSLIYEPMTNGWAVSSCEHSVYGYADSPLNAVLDACQRQRKDNEVPQ